MQNMLVKSSHRIQAPGPSLCHFPKLSQRRPVQFQYVCAKFDRRNSCRRGISIKAIAESTAAREAQALDFLSEMRSVAMKLHTKEQSPKEGESKKQSTPVQKMQPTLQGYFNFLIQSKIVYDKFEQIFKEAQRPEYANFQNNGMERGATLDRDIKWFKETYDVQEDPSIACGSDYAKLLDEIATKSPPKFICHFYNHYFAHTAGGVMIGRMVAKSILDGHTLDFYKYEGDLKQKQTEIRNEINLLAESWNQEERQQSLDETVNTFYWGGELLRLITA
eukprot:TRINITY_DN1731_c0_g1_i1.p2 TRINITY_DN1731_c0_g1~~TRINITY_DN1731_c0_g1_i1.p2  ORF type:complete len:277 (-),score=27.24 TRINITY_DN1731_c0_g1_i1:272-1102(-)